MPCSPQRREKLTLRGSSLPNARVSRSAGRKEMLSNPRAWGAMRKEWNGLRSQGVFDMSVVREVDDVRREAKETGSVVHFARVHGIMVEKNGQLNVDDPRRKYKLSCWETRWIKRCPMQCSIIWETAQLHSKLQDGLTSWVVLMDGRFK